MKQGSWAIFDFDGTLVDSQWVWQTMLLRVLAERGHEIDEADVERCLDRDWLAFHAEFLEKYGEAKPLFSHYRDLHAYMEIFYRDRVLWKPGAREYLEYLKEQGVRLAIYSTTPEYLLRTALGRLEATDLFDVLISGEDRGWSKKDPESFRKCMDLLGTDTEHCVMFEDSLYSIRSAKEAGMTVYAVQERCFRHNREKICALADRFGVHLTDFME